MTAVRELHKVCVVARKYPATLYFLLTCGVLASGVTQNLVVMSVLLTIQLALIGHTTHRMWQPPIWWMGDHMTQAPGGGRHVRDDP